MLATMKMRMATTWGNDVELALSTELDNAHVLTTAEMFLLMTLSMRKMCDTVREQNERVIENDPPSAHARQGVEPEYRGEPERERTRLAELREDRDKQEHRPQRTD